MNKTPPAPLPFGAAPVQPEPWKITNELVLRVRTIPGAMPMLDGGIYFPDMEGCWVLLPYGTMLSVVKLAARRQDPEGLYLGLTTDLLHAVHVGKDHEGYARDRALVEQALSWSTAFLT